MPDSGSIFDLCTELCPDINRLGVSCPEIYITAVQSRLDMVNDCKPVFAERKRKHVPISYKPPEKLPSGPGREQRALDAAKIESRLEKRGSGAEQADALTKRGSNLESRPSDLDRAVSRTESGQKLSVFERLQR